MCFSFLTITWTWDSLLVKPTSQDCFEIVRICIFWALHSVCPCPKSTVNGSSNCIINVVTLLRQNKKSTLFLAVFFVYLPGFFWGKLREYGHLRSSHLFLELAEQSSRKWDLDNQQLGNRIPTRGGGKICAIKFPVFPFSFTALHLPSG